MWCWIDGVIQRQSFPEHTNDEGHASLDVFVFEELLSMLTGSGGEWGVHKRSDRGNRVAGTCVSGLVVRKYLLAWGRCPVQQC